MGCHYTGLQCSLCHNPLLSTATKPSKLHLKFKACSNISTVHFRKHKISNKNGRIKNKVDR
jgi:hypothetical protein